jgi:AGZA family xanthine/uracil permease-like MFS transporter
MKCIPRAVKISTIVGMGLQIALVGMTSINLVVENDYTLVELGSLNDIHIWLALSGLILISSLSYHNIKGSILIGIFIVSIFTWYIDNSFPNVIIQSPVLQSRISDLINFSEFDLSSMISGILAFIFIGLVDVSGVIFGMSSLAGITEDSGKIPGSLYAFLGCGIGTIVGAATGQSHNQYMLII